jgi:Na+/proline symporter
MTYLDWIVLGIFFAYTIWDGMRAGKGERSMEKMLLAGRSQNWWVIGISVMATQASAITFIGATGQSFMYDMRFLQVYLGLPIAMVILCLTLVPFFYRLKVYTAYEALENRFGLPVRLTTSAFFLISRGASLGITIAAPAYVLALVLDWSLTPTILLIGSVATVYTLFGGIAAVLRTDMKQMLLMLIGLVFCFVYLVYRLPEGVGFGDSLHLAGVLGKLEILDFNWDMSEKYNIWSGLIAGLFLMLSYFGADQSMVQRYLTAKSLTDARASLIFSAIFKIPMQFFILLLGVNLFVFYLFADRPLLFFPDTNEAPSTQVRVFDQVNAERRKTAFAFLASPDDPKLAHQLQELNEEAQQLRWKEIHRLETVSESPRNDTNYVFPFFMLTELPPGITGLLIAAILAATLSSVDSMLNSLTASTVVDWYQRLGRSKKTEQHYLYITYAFTAFWGLFATLTALFFGETESIIEVVNQLGSYFYGSILGVFLLLFTRRATGFSALAGLGISLGVVLVVGLFSPIEYLWLNPIGLLVAWFSGFVLGGGNARLPEA